ncbi:ORF19A [Fowl aviadenovirus C]|uniref:ORF19A n=1 Tax=Fowl aviadenovirus C TaxID=190063 RepID=H8WQY7_9ADEN|nr:ORF19A [Fowl aviadenovirus C]CCE39395.1 ORF19A [Fowl aviadenovirus C]
MANFSPVRHEGHINYFWYGQHGMAPPRIHGPLHDNDMIYWRLRDRGFLRGGREKNLILLVHGWHGLHRTFDIFFKFLRFHQKMTPDVGVLLVDWGVQGADNLILGDAAYHAVTINIDGLLKNINRTNLHCIGHSLGAHACGAICRRFNQLQNRKCTRIVGLDPAGPLFKTNSPYPYLTKARLSKKDADYVALFMTNRRMMGLHELEGDEYITPYIDGTYLNHCPFIGKWTGTITAENYQGRKVTEYIDLGTVAKSGVIPHTMDACSHLMAPVLFMVSLDTRQGLPAFRYAENPPQDQGAMHTVWNGYTIGKDYQYPAYFKHETIWLSTLTTDANQLSPFEFQHEDSIDPSFMAMAISDKGCISAGSHLSYHYSVIPYGNKYDLVTSFSALSPGMADTHFLEVYMNYKHCPVYLARFLIPKPYQQQLPRPTTAGLSSEMLSCRKQTTYTWSCYRTWKQAVLPVYRQQLDLTGDGKFNIQVPPKHGCLKEQSNFTDMFRTYMGAYEVLTDQTVTVTSLPSPFELIRIALRDPASPTIQNIMTYWDMCDPVASTCSFTVNRATRTLNITCPDPKTYWISFFYQWEEVLLKIDVRPKPTTATTTTTTTTTTTPTTTTTTTPTTTTTTTPTTTTTTTPTTTTTTTPTTTTTTTPTTTSTESITEPSSACDEEEDEDCWFEKYGDQIEVPQKVQLPFKVANNEMSEPTTAATTPSSTAAIEEEENSTEPIDYSDWVVIGEESNSRASTPPPLQLTVAPGTNPPLQEFLWAEPSSKDSLHKDQDSTVTIPVTIGLLALVCLSVIIAVFIALRRRGRGPRPTFIVVPGTGNNTVYQETTEML